MDIVTLTAFDNELTKIADGVGMVAKKVLPTVAPKIKPVSHLDLLANVFKKSPSWASKAKSAGAAGALGAMGAGLSALHGGLREWDTRAAENRALAKMDPKQYSAAKQHIDASRRHRLQRLGVNAALAGGSGALIGHYGGKAIRSLSESASKGLAEHIKPALKDTSKQLGEDLASGLQKGSHGSFWRAINPFKKK